MRIPQIFKGILDMELDPFPNQRNNIVDSMVSCIAGRYSDVDEGDMAATRLADMQNLPPEYQEGLLPVIILCRSIIINHDLCHAQTKTKVRHIIYLKIQHLFE